MIKALVKFCNIVVVFLCRRLDVDFENVFQTVMKKKTELPRLSKG